MTASVSEEGMRKIIVMILILSAACLTAVPFQGGQGLIYLHSAHVLKKGYLDVSGGIRYFGKIASFGGEEKAFTLWVVKGSLSVNYGLSERVELFFAPVFYQDINRPGKSGLAKDKGINMPDDLFLGVKFGSFQKLESPAVFGGRLMLRIPTADTHNVIYEEYSAGSLEIHLQGLFSYYSNLTFPDAGWSLHANIGYINHNDVGQSLTDSENDVTPQAMSAELTVGAGVRLPAGMFDFSLELNNSTFLTKPPINVYSREYSSYLTGGVYYHPNPWLTFQMGLDLRLVSDHDLSVYLYEDPQSSLPRPPTEEFPNYPSWRGILGFKMALLPKSIRMTDEEELRRQSRDRRAILEKMMNEQQDTQNAEEELERIKNERQRVEQELERLRRLLEAEKKKDQ
jgi:hypothetical protein